MKSITKLLFMPPPIMLVNAGVLIFLTSFFFLFPECSSVIPLDQSLVTVTDTYNRTTTGADKVIITDLKDYASAWCTKNTSGTAQIKVRDSKYFASYS
jgi:hypothetical protein